MQTAVMSKRPLGGSVIEISPKQQANDGSKLFKSVTVNNWGGKHGSDADVVRRFCTSEVRRVVTTSSSDESDEDLPHVPMIRVHTQDPNRLSTKSNTEEIPRSHSLFVHKKVSLPSSCVVKGNHQRTSSSSAGHPGDLRKKVSLHLDESQVDSNIALGYERHGTKAMLQKSKSGSAVSRKERRLSVASGENPQHLARSVSLRSDGVQRNRLHTSVSITSCHSDSEDLHKRKTRASASHNKVHQTRAFVKSHTFHPYLHEGIDRENSDPPLHHTSTWAPDVANLHPSATWHAHDWSRANSFQLGTPSLHKTYSVEPPGLESWNAEDHEQHTQAPFWTAAHVTQRPPSTSQTLVYDPFYGMQLVDSHTLQTVAAAAYSQATAIATASSARYAASVHDTYPADVGPLESCEERGHAADEQAHQPRENAYVASGFKSKVKNHDTVPAASSRASSHRPSSGNRLTLPIKALSDKRQTSDLSTASTQVPQVLEENVPAEMMTSSSRADGGARNRVQTPSSSADANAGEKHNDIDPEISAMTDIDRMPHSKIPENLKTTVMLKNISNNITEKRLMERMAEHGFSSDTFDFLHLPTDCKTKSNLGYAFINFVSSTSAASFKETFDGLKLGSNQSQKVCSVTYARIQGKARNMKLNGRRQAHGSKSKDACPSGHGWSKGNGKRSNPVYNANCMAYFGETQSTDLRLRIVGQPSAAFDAQTNGWGMSEEQWFGNHSGYAPWMSTVF